MPNTRNFRDLRKQVLERPGAAERLAELQKEALAEIGLYELRKQLDWSQSGLADKLGISQAAVSQLENAEDMSLSRLRNYLEQLGGRLQVLAVFDNGEQEHSIPIRIGSDAEPSEPGDSTSSTRVLVAAVPVHPARVVADPR